MPKKKSQRNRKVYTRSILGPTFRPIPPAAKADDVWKRVEDLLSKPSEPAKPVDAPKQRKRGEARRKRRLRRKVRLFDALGTITWIGILVKLFIGDLDRLLVSSFAPQAVWLLDLRWFLVLALTALLLLLFQSKTLGLGIAYVLSFPLVVAFWKIPKVLFVRRSPLLIMGLAALITNLAVRAKRIVYALAITCLSALIIVLAETSWLVGIAAAAMLVTLVWWLVVTTIDMLRTPSFISAQETLLENVLSWGIIEKLLTPSHPNRPTLNEWSTEDAKGYRDSAGNALLAHRVATFWAHSLDQYRKGPTVVIFNCFATLGLMLQVVLVFSFVNLGVYVIEPSQFEFSNTPDWWTFAYYSAAGSYFGEIGALNPAMGLATIVKILNGFVGLGGLLTVVLTVVLGYRSIRAETSSLAAIQLLEKKAEEVETISTEQYQMTVRELEDRLIAAHWGLYGLASWLAARTSVSVRGTEKPIARE